MYMAFNADFSCPILRSRIYQTYPGSGPFCNSE